MDDIELMWWDFNTGQWFTGGVPVPPSPKLAITGTMRLRFRFG